MTQEEPDKSDWSPQDHRAYKLTGRVPAKGNVQHVARKAIITMNATAGNFSKWPMHWQMA
jgi:hypothetical protein